MKDKILILGMPINSGQPKVGTHLGPEALRNAQIVERLQELGYTVTDLGNLELDEFVAETGDSSLKNLDHVIKSCTELSNTIDKMNLKDEFPLILGGDHSMAIGTLSGIAKNYENLGVIWFDAHCDLNISDSSPSGNIHGMSLSSSLGFGDKRLVSVGGYHPKIKVENTVLIGVREIDEGEILLIKETGIKVYTMEEVNKLGMDRVISESIQHLSNCDGVHLSLDVDGFCTALTPGTGTRVEGGVNHADGLTFLKTLRDSDIITSMEIVEINPNLEEYVNQTALTTVDLVINLFKD